MSFLLGKVEGIEIQISFKQGKQALKSDSIGSILNYCSQIWKIQIPQKGIKIMWCTEIVHEVRESKSVHVLDRISEVNIPVASNIFGYVGHCSWGSRGEGFHYRSIQSISSFESLQLQTFSRTATLLTWKGVSRITSGLQLRCMAMYEIKINIAQPIATVKGLEVSRARLWLWIPNKLVKKACLQKNIIYHLQTIFQILQVNGILFLLLTLITSIL